MNKKELVDSICLSTDVPKGTVDGIVNAVFEKMIETVSSGSEVTIYGFGTFSVKNTESRKGRNPRTGASIDIPAGKKLVFKVAKAFKDAIV